jgi:hypothetical protein
MRVSRKRQPCYREGRKTTYPFVPLPVLQTIWRLQDPPGRFRIAAASFLQSLIALAVFLIVRSALLTDSPAMGQLGKPCSISPDRLKGNATFLGSQELDAIRTPQIQKTFNYYLCWRTFPNGNHFIAPCAVLAFNYTICVAYVSS